MSDKFSALKASKDPIEFWGNKSPKCPHCGKDYDISDNEAWELYNDDDSHDVTCPSCDGDFRVTSQCSWTFSTDEQEDDDDD